MVKSAETPPNSSKTLPDVNGEALTDDEKTLHIALQLTRPLHRLVLFVEEARDWAEINAQALMKRFDPTLGRTVIVCNKFLKCVFAMLS